MDPSTLLPIRPTSPTLPSHLSALSTTISHLESLPSQTRWPAYIPLTSRARLPGQIVHPNEVKVKLGEGWWVDMTAAEAADYLRRRKMALLEEQAKLLEGGSRRTTGTTTQMASTGVLPPPVHLNSLFMGMDTARAVQKGKETAPAAADKSSPPARTKPMPSPTSAIKASRSSSSTTNPPVTTTPASSSIQPQTAEPQSLEAVLERSLENEQSLAESSSGGRDTTTTEDGLPIHEIHETASGDIIGVTPEPTLSEAEAGAVAADTEKRDEGKKGDYDSEEARARRRKLWEKVFGTDDDDDEDDGDREEEMKGEETDEKTPVSPTTSSPRSASPELIAPLPSTRSSAPAHPAPTPRSILKAPPQPVRKKSVSFDPAVPLPPDSPDPSSRKMGFQLPIVGGESDVGEFGVRPVPVIQAPKPKKGDEFGGMKRGFLDPPGGTKKGEGEGGKKKPSLFAQRMAQSTVKETSTQQLSAPAAAVAASAPKARVPGLPIMAKSASATNTLRSSVVEKPIASSSTLTPSSARPPSQPKTYPTGDSGGDDVGLIDDDDDEDDEEEEEEDEYDLDDALLAREVALEYHRRRAYASPYISQDPDDPSYGHLPSDPSDSGGVLLAMPQVDSSSGQPTIINPTPDDFRRFVRVGKLENGNLVLAPGEEGWSDDEEGENGEGVGEMELERRKKRDNRRKVMAGLLGGEGGEGEAGLRGKGMIGNPTRVPEPLGKKEHTEEVPPVVEPAPRETSAPAVGGVKERDAGEVVAPSAEPPKKMSRFKAARMGGA